ncbi:hypothetical protein [Nocardia sp. NPDC005366]|uniref:hypothetical protein n=1 Tax=Nocardia sp. NPDC005366 TaxID=3156878 RepID=UPI00339FB147
MGDNESRGDFPQFTEQGYWQWRDGLQAGLSVDAPEIAPSLVREASAWYQAFMRAQERLLVRRAVVYGVGVTIVALGVVAVAAVAGVAWHDRAWVVVLCAVVAVVALYRYVSTLAATRTAHNLERRVLSRQFPAPETIWEETVRKHTA